MDRELGLSEEKLQRKIEIIWNIFESKLIEFVKFFYTADKQSMSVRKLKRFCSYLSSREIWSYKDRYIPRRIDLDLHLMEIFYETFADLSVVLSKYSCGLVNIGYIDYSLIDLRLINNAIIFRLKPQEKAYLYSFFCSVQLSFRNFDQRSWHPSESPDPPSQDFFYRIFLTDESGVTKQL